MSDWAEQQQYFEDRLHRTWAQFLLDHEYREAAAIAVDSAVDVSYEGSYDPVELRIWLPTSAYGILNTNEHLKKAMEQALRVVSEGHVIDQNGTPVEVPIRFIVNLMQVEEGWQDVIRRLIVQSQDPNQGVITEKAFSSVTVAQSVTESFNSAQKRHF